MAQYIYKIYNDLPGMPEEYTTSMSNAQKIANKLNYMYAMEDPYKFNIKQITPLKEFPIPDYVAFKGKLKLISEDGYDHKALAVIYYDYTIPPDTPDDCLIFCEDKARTKLLEGKTVKFIIQLKIADSAYLRCLFQTVDEYVEKQRSIIKEKVKELELGVDPDKTILWKCANYNRRNNSDN